MLIISVMPSILAIDIVIKQQSYEPQETLQAEITGNFITLGSKNILIYREGIPRPMPVISELILKNDIYHFYALLPKTQGNYSLKIKDAEYLLEGEVETETLSSDFTIQRTNKSVLSIKPGFILTNDNFSIKITSPYKNQDISAEFKATGETKNLSLVEGQEQEIIFKIPQESVDSSININSYSIPVFIITESGQIIIAKKTDDLNFIPSELIATISSGEDYFFKLLLRNSGNKNLTNIRLSTDLDATIEPNSIDTLESNEELVIEITIKIPNNQEDNLSVEIPSQG